MYREEKMLLIRNSFFLDLLDTARENNNKQLARFLARAVRRNGSLAYLYCLFIFDIFFSHIRGATFDKKICWKKERVLNEREMEQVITRPFKKRKHLCPNANLINYYDKLMASPIITWDEKMNLQLLINEIAVMNSRDFCLMLKDYLNKEFELDVLFLSNLRNLASVFPRTSWRAKWRNQLKVLFKHKSHHYIHDFMWKVESFNYN